MNRRSTFNEKEAAKTGTSSCPETTHLVPRTARDISNPSCARAQRRLMSVQVHRTTCAQTTEPGSTMANSRTFSYRPLTKVPASSKTNCHARHSQRISSVVTPNSRKLVSSQSKLRSRCTERALWGTRVLRRPPSGCTLGYISCQKKCIKKCELGENDV